MIDRGRYLFVYGTLRPGKAPAEIAPIVDRLAAVGDGFVRGHLHDLGSYPGVVLDDAGDEIPGTIFQLPEEPEVLRRLDEYEEFDAAQPEASLFIRKEWPVRSDLQGTLTCWVYAYNPGAAAVPSEPGHIRNGRPRQ